MDFNTGVVKNGVKYFRKGDAVVMTDDVIHNGPSIYT